MFHLPEIWVKDILLVVLLLFAMSEAHGLSTLPLLALWGRETLAEETSLCIQEDFGRIALPFFLLVSRLSVTTRR